MSKSNLTALEQYKKEFSVDDDGKGFVTKKGTARLCGVDPKAIRYLLSTIERGEENLPEMLQPFAGQRFERGEKLPDVLVSAIVKYYAYQGKEVSQQTDTLLGAVGIRALIQETLGYKRTEKRSLTPEEIVELCCLPVPTEWQCRFPEEYYKHLERLTGLPTKDHTRPAYWALLTKELVYDYMPTGIYDTVKRCKEETGSWDKLHQFLSLDGIRILETHQRQLLTYMEAASSINDLKRMLDAAKSKRYQLLLF